MYLMNIKQSSEGEMLHNLEAVDKDTQTMQTTEIPVVGM